ncbi:prephenate dehydrogenase [Halobacillus karajensis]|uniref:Prephenate dehydrogenase n=1 Tax=Halobacillus karajensis TaxID=195088 RepID=A0A024P251_9BACI|nr:prephenate dehydrogenase [Halobacillus karajensis]CDQ19504.1 Arogenate dehydrogenase [Halobacillus karajensis]CDQ21966.1 Arogenate dehydrogenase [Halobacillus karajensis]CDQ27807.1 Arogenate dehydrogenase [Halobacillus karajensis]SEH81279.1 prephenate dehydrogenase [Halobacillus karajensis]
MKQTVLVVGLGLIGGSIAMNVSKKEDVFIIGMDGDEDTLNMALKQGVIDQAAFNFKEAVIEADVCILATPISITIEYIHRLENIQLNKPLLVTDVSSVKNQVLEAANRLNNPLLSFVGGHPMAGSHKQGYTAAKPHLFENAIYVLTPSIHANEKEADRLKALFSETHARFLIFTTEEHDEMTAVISHFPHLIASSLVHQARGWEETHPYIKHLAAGGFKDITRIASSNPKLWQDIFFQNKDLLISMLDDWIGEMDKIKTYLSENEKEKTFKYLSDAKLYRDGLPVKEKGAIPAFYDVYVDIHDQPGAIRDVIGILAEEAISIKNIQILEIREGITGVLRISFATSKEQLKSKQILGQYHYEVMIQQ